MCDGNRDYEWLATGWAGGSSNVVGVFEISEISVYIPVIIIYSMVKFDLCLMDTVKLISIFRMI